MTISKWIARMAIVLLAGAGFALAGCPPAEEREAPPAEEPMAPPQEEPAMPEEDPGFGDDPGF